MRKTFSLILGALLVTTPAVADVVVVNNNNASAPGYGPAGCGLGSVIFGRGGGILQIFAATTNGTSANQTFAITSGTSNCSNSGGGVASAKSFIETNREALAKDISRGSGETIASLATLAGCPDPKAVGTTLQKSFSTIFPNASTPDEAVTSSILTVLKTDKELACTNAG
jgi:hypothetical protein